MGINGHIAAVGDRVLNEEEERDRAMKEEIVACLGKIGALIVCNIHDCEQKLESERQKNRNSNPDVVMAGTSPQSSKTSRTVVKKQTPRRTGREQVSSDPDSKEQESEVTQPGAA